MAPRLFLSSGDLVADRRYEFARDLQLKGDLPAAAELLEQAIELVPKFPSAWYTLGKIRLELGQRDAAIAAFRAARDADHLNALDERMASAIGSFKANGSRMTEALSRLAGDTATIRELLSGAAARLAKDSADIDASLREAIVSIDDIAVDLGDHEVDEAGAALIDEMLRASYTMASERNIHDGFVGQSGAGGERFAAESPGEDQSVDDCLF